MPAVTPSALADLLSASAADVDDAWQNFLAQYSRLILSVCRSMEGDYDAAMDRYAFIVQQLRRDEFRKLRGYLADPRCKFTTWLVVVCKRLCIDWHRSKFGRARPSSDVISFKARRSLSDSLLATAELEKLAAPEEHRPDAWIEREVYTHLEACLARLEARDRLLIKLRFEDGLGAVEIMRLLQLPTPFHVYRRINRILKDLRVAMTLGAPTSAQESSSRPFHIR